MLISTAVEWTKRLMQKQEVIYYTLSLIFARFIGLLIPKLIISEKGEVEYGKFVLILGLISMVINFFSGSLTNCVSKYSRQQRSFGEIFIQMGRILGPFILAITLFFFLFSLTIQHVLPVYQIDGLPLSLGTFYVFFMLSNAFLTGIHFVTKSYIRMSIANFVAASVLAIGTVIFLRFFDISGALLSYILFSAVTVFLLIQFYPNFTTSSGVWKPQASNIFKDFLIPSSLSASIVPIAIWISNLIVLEHLGFVELGLVSIFFQIQLLYNFLPGILNSIWLPKLNQLYSSNRADYFLSLKSLFYYTTGISLSIFIFISIFSGPLLTLLSPKYLPFLNVFYVFNASFFMSNLIATAGQHIMSSDQVWWGFGLNLIWGFVLVFSTLAFVPHFKLLGYGLAFLSAYSAHFVFVTYFVVQLKKSDFTHVA